MKSNREQWGLDSFCLKCIALLGMAVDHTGRILFPELEVLVVIGRISFPIFAFLLTEGFAHTRDVRKYLRRLGIFAVLSEIFFDLAFFGTLWYPQRQNVFFTMFLGVLLLHVLERESSRASRVLEILLVMWAAELLRADYGFRGILLICLFWMFREQRAMLLAAGVLWNFLWGSAVQAFGALAAVPLGLYSGKKGRDMKYFFYIFYPAHLFVLYIIERLIGKS